MVGFRVGKIMVTSTGTFSGGCPVGSTDGATTTDGYGDGADDENEVGSVDGRHDRNIVGKTDGRKDGVWLD